jgi:hypothetical protein
MNCHPDRSVAEWRACPARTRMGTCCSLHHHRCTWKQRPNLCHPDRSEAKRRDLLFTPPANGCTWKHHPPLCHPERSRGICSSAGLSWKCFLTPADVPRGSLMRNPPGTCSRRSRSSQEAVLHPFFASLLRDVWVFAADAHIGKTGKLTAESARQSHRAESSPVPARFPPGLDPRSTHLTELPRP